MNRFLTIRIPLKTSANLINRWRIYAARMIRAGKYPPKGKAGKP